MADVEIGRVTIRVSPDTKGFRGETAREVGAACDSIEENVDVGADTDFSNVKPEAAAAAKAAKQDVDFEGNFDKANANLDSLYDNARRLRAEVNRIRLDRRALGTGPDFKAQREAMDAQILGLDKQKESNRLAIERAKLAVDAAKKQKEQLETGKDLNKEEIKLGINQEKNFRLRQWAANQAATSQKRLHDAELRHEDTVAAARKKFALDVARIDERNAAKRLRDQEKLSSSRQRDIDTEYNVMMKGARRVKELASPRFGTGISPAGYAVIFTAITALIGPVLGTLYTALLALPGVISLIAGPVGALALGFDGLKFAAQGLKGPLDRLKTAMSAKTADVFTPIFDRLREPIESDQIRDAFAAVIDGAGTSADKVAEFITSFEGMRRVEAILRNVGSFWDQSATGWENVTDWSTGLTEELTKNAPDMADWFNGVNEQFRQWVNKISADGSLQAAFGNLGGVVEKIVDGIGNIGAKAVEVFGSENGADMLLGVLELIEKMIIKLLDLSEEFGASLQLWAQMVRPIVGISQALQGDYKGALLTLKDFALNEPFLQYPEQPDTDRSEKFVEEWDTQMRDMVGALPPIQGPGIAPPQILEPTKAEKEAKKERDKAVKEVVDLATAQIGGAMTSVSGKPLPAPDFSEWKGAWEGNVSTVQTAVAQINEAVAPEKLTVKEDFTNAFMLLKEPVVAGMGEAVGAVRTGIGDIVTECEGLSGKVAGAVTGLQNALYTQGAQLVEGLVRGIRDNTHRAVTQARILAAATAAGSAGWWGISSPAEETVNQGEEVVNGMVLGLHGKAYLAQKAMIDSLTPTEQTKKAIRDGQKILEDTSGVPGIGPGYTEEMMKGRGWSAAEQQRLDVLTKSYKDLNRALKYLRQDLAASDAAGDVAIQAEIDRVKEIKKRIKLEKDALDLQREAAGVKEKSNKEDKTAGDYLSDAVSAGMDFAMANSNQFQSDLGISGTGAISAGINEGINWLSGTMSNLLSGVGGGNIIVNNVDDAVAAYDYKDRKAAKQYVGRSSS